MTQCIGVKPNGNLCKGIATRDSDYCPAHDPTRKEARRRNAKKAARSKPSRELTSIKRRLSDLAEEVLEGATDRADAAVVSQIWNTYIRAVSIELKVKEIEEMETKLEEMAEALERQREGGSYGSAG
jgi:hypothetical protein